MANLTTLTTSQQREWQDALDRCVAYDFYHLPQYHALAEEQGEGTARLFVFEEGPYGIALPLLLRSLESLPFATSIGTGWRDATSVYGYAGPVCSHAEIPVAVRANFQSRLETRLRELRVISVFSRLNPLLSQAGLLTGLGECPSLSRTVSIDLTLSPEDQRAGFRKSQKTAVNKCRRRGITCAHDPALVRLADFVDIYHETMRRVEATEMYFFPHSYFDRLCDLARSRVHLFTCRHEDRIVAAGLFLSCGGILQYHLGGTRNEAMELGPSKVLIDDVRIWATQQGFRVLHLGGGTTPRPDDPLLHFKTGFSRVTHDFRVWRWTLFGEVYQELCRQRAAWDEGSASVAGYYPEYRSPSIRSEPALALASPEESS